MFITVILKRIAAWMRYRANLHELGQLTDRELADVGLSRNNLEYTARVGDERSQFRGRSQNRLDGAHRERESTEISLSEKLVSSLALAVLLGGFLCGAFTKWTDTGPSLRPVVSNASAKNANYEIRTRVRLTAAISD
jgi:uncharacterized protein YjiS (DUF1127 family)